MHAPFWPAREPGAGDRRDWGREEYVADLLGHGFELEFEEGELRVTAEPGEEMWHLFTSYDGAAKAQVDSLVMSNRGHLDTLATAVRAAVARRTGWRETARLVASELERHLPSPSILTAEQRAGDHETLRSHVLHSEPDGSFSIVALVRRAGQMTRIHDHVTWGRSPSSRASSTRTYSGSTRRAHASSRLGAR